MAFVLTMMPNKFDSHTTSKRHEHVPLTIFIWFCFVFNFSHPRENGIGRFYVRHSATANVTLVLVCSRAGFSLSDNEEKIARNSHENKIDGTVNLQHIEIFSVWMQGTSAWFWLNHAILICTQSWHKQMIPLETHKTHTHIDNDNENNFLANCVLRDFFLYYCAPMYSVRK